MPAVMCPPGAKTPGGHACFAGISCWYGGTFYAWLVALAGEPVSDLVAAGHGDAVLQTELQEGLWPFDISVVRQVAVLLEGGLSTDVLIIGGGMAGVLCAYFLHRAGVPYALAEAKALCSGITGNTTAKITSQHGLIYDKLIRKFGVDRARQYLSAQEAALQKYRELCQTMDCELEEKDAYVYSMDNRRKIERELNALEKLGFPENLPGSSLSPFPWPARSNFPVRRSFIL